MDEPSPFGSYEREPTGPRLVVGILKGLCVICGVGLVAYLALLAIMAAV